MKVVAFGANGMVGSRVVELLHADFDFVTPSEDEVDITNRNILEEYLSKEKPQIVINFAAITDVDFCETQRENKNSLVWKVNALAPKTISSLSKKLDIFFIQISTDMVFPGSKSDPGPYSEDHKTTDVKNLTWYGASKAAGEKNVLQENPKSAVVRIIYPVRASFPHKLDYARKILKMYDDKQLYPMFDDQYMNVTYIDELSLALKILAERKISGVFHVSSSDTTTPYEFASYLIEKCRSAKGVVQKTSFEKFIAGRDRRRYPEYGGLKCEITQRALRVKFSTWREIIDSLTSILQTI